MYTTPVYEPNKDLKAEAIPSYSGKFTSWVSILLIYLLLITSYLCNILHVIFGYDWRLIEISIKTTAETKK